MGSRGAGSGIKESDKKPLGGGGGGNGKEPITVHMISTAPQDLRETLGEQGRPMGMDRALKGANPFYTGGDEGDYSNNCQRAVIAYEARRRGYDVVAQPTYAGDQLPSGDKWKGAFMHGKSVHVGASTPQKTQENLESKMKSYGSGARAIVSIPGHVFNCENVGGKIRYIDAQTNTVYSSKNVFSRIGKKSNTISIMRTDNLRFSDRAKKSVTPVTDTMRRTGRTENKNKR